MKIQAPFNLMCFILWEQTMFIYEVSDPIKGNDNLLKNTTAISGSRQKNLSTIFLCKKMSKWKYIGRYFVWFSNTAYLINNQLGKFPLKVVVISKIKEWLKMTPEINNKRLKCHIHVGQYITKPIPLKSMKTKPVKTLELHHPMIHFQ